MMESSRSESVTRDWSYVKFLKEENNHFLLHLSFCNYSKTLDHDGKGLFSSHERRKQEEEEEEENIYKQ